MKTTEGDRVRPVVPKLADRYVGALATLIYRRRIEEFGPEAAIDPYVERRRVQVPQQRRSPENA